jgi:hypothetical protein
MKTFVLLIWVCPLINYMGFPIILTSASKPAATTRREQMFKTYLTKQIGDLTIVYYVDRNLGQCHVAYYKADGSAA